MSASRSDAEKPLALGAPLYKNAGYRTTVVPRRPRCTNGHKSSGARDPTDPDGPKKLVILLE
jgi:hypothetical protein